MKRRMTEYEAWRQNFDIVDKTIQKYGDMLDSIGTEFRLQIYPDLEIISRINSCTRYYRKWKPLRDQMMDNFRLSMINKIKKGYK